MCGFSVSVFARVGVLTYYLNQVGQHHSILEVTPEVGDRPESWPPSQLSIHPGNIGCQLLL